MSGLVERQYYVYILASERQTLSIGVTNDLPRRVLEHKKGRGSMFTARYGCVKPVYYEASTDVREAIEREKQLKG